MTVLAQVQLTPEWLVRNLTAQVTFTVITTLIVAVLLFLPLRMWRLPKGRAGSIMGLTALIFALTEPLLKFLPEMEYSDGLPIAYCIVLFLLVYAGLKSRPAKNEKGDIKE